MTSRPSYELKVDRAEKHLVELEDALRRYASEHPYEMRSGMEGHKKRVVHRLWFTMQPDPEVGLIAADFIYNLRSALDHLMAALVPPSRRRKVYFPIYWQGVWEPDVEGEDKQRTKDRCRWRSDTLEAHPDAVAFLQRAQPPHSGRNDPASLHGLVALNRLAVNDRHSKLPVIATALRDFTLRWQDADGLGNSVNAPDSVDGLGNRAELNLPHGAVNVEIEGTPQVMVRVGAPDSGYRIPEVFREVLLLGTRQIIGELHRFTP